MQTAASFKCPHCAAPVPFQYGQHTVECAYCGNTVIVPPELRPPPPQPPPYQYSQVQVIIGPESAYTAQPQPTYAVPAARTGSRRRSSCLPALIFTIVLLGLAGGVLSFVAATSPFFFDNLFAGGFARLEQTYGSDEATPNAQSMGSVSEAVDVDLDSAGNVYVVTYNGRIARFAPDGASLGSWSIEGKDVHPGAIEVDGAGNVYVAVGSDIRKYDDATGFEQRIIDVPEIFGASDVALAPDGSILTFLGGSLDQILRFDPTGMEVARYERPITEYEPGAVTAPWLVRIATGSQGQIYLLNTSVTGTPIFVFSPEGRHLTHFGVRGDEEGQLSSPGAIAIDSKGRIYVSDSSGVQVFDQDGEYIGVIRMPFSYRPGGMTFDDQDRLYVVSRGAKKVYRFVLNEP
ncbi:MAG: NHL repeat-containing protein [Chloroflexia bacterium]